MAHSPVIGANNKTQQSTIRFMTTTINHSIHDYIIGLKQVLSNMSSSDSNCSFAVAPRRVVEDTVAIVDKKTFSCEAIEAGGWD
jgi:hypothetical protein